MKANRNTIAEFFNTDILTTHRILMNLNWGFFNTHFGDKKDEMWELAHPFNYPDGSKDFTEISIDFINQHFNLFASNQLTTLSGWGDINPITRKAEWEYKIYYREAEITFN